MNREFTASVYIFNEDKILLHFHKKLNCWLPPGGHVEPNELPQETAFREVLEETGLRVKLLPQENIMVDEWNAKSIIRPYLCLLEEIPQWNEVPPHQHIDFVFLARLDPCQGHSSTEGSEKFHWFCQKEFESLSSDALLPETKKVLEHLFETFSCVPTA